MNDKKANIKTKKAKRPGRGKRRLLRVVFVIFGLFGVIQALLFYFSDPFIRRILQEKINEESQGIYTIEFEKIHLNLATRGIKVKKLKVSPKSALLNKIKQDSVNSYYDLYFPEIEINGIGLLKLYYSDVLEIASVEITEPEADFLGAKQASELNKHNRFHKDVYPFINKYFSALVIKKLKFSNGSLILSQNLKGKKANSTAGDIFITLNDFRIDSSSADIHHKLLFSDHIELDIEDYRLKLSDGIHVLEAEEINLNTSTSTIQGKKIWLLPSMATDSLKNNEKEEFYDIYIPKLAIDGADIYKAYFDDVLNVNMVQLDEPEIRFITQKKFTDVEADSLQKNLYSLCSAYLNVINVDSFTINEGIFSIAKRIEQTKPDILANEINVNIGQFLVDSASFNNTSKIFYADQLKVSIGNYTMDLADSVHLLKAQNVDFSTIDKKAIAKQVSLEPKAGKKRPQGSQNVEVYDIRVPNLQFEGVNFKKVYNFRLLEFDELTVAQPAVSISDYSFRRTSNGQYDEASLYGLIKNYVKSIHVNEIKLNEGSLEYAHYKGAKKDTIRARRIDFTLDNFKLDSVGQYTSNRIFFADHITFNLNDYLMKLSDDLHILRAKQVGISTVKSQIFANNIALFPIPVANIKAFLERSKRSVLYDIKIPSLLISGADLRKAYFQRYLNIDNITIDNPEVKLNNYTEITKRKRNASQAKDDLYGLFSDYLRSINIAKMKLNRGLFNVITNTNRSANTLSQNDVSIEATNFVLNSQSSNDRSRIFYSDDIEVKLNNYLVNLPDSVHVLRTREVGVSTAKSEIYLKSSRLYPTSKRLDTVNLPAFYDVEVPDIVMKGVDINKLYYRNILEIDDILLKNPTCRIINQVEIKGKNRFITESRKASMPAKLKGIKIKDVKLQNGKLALGNLIGNKNKIFSTTNLSMNLKDFVLDSLILNNNRKILYANNVELDMGQYNLKLPDSIHIISADKIYVSSGKKTLAANNFRLKPRPKQDYAPLFKNQKNKLLYDLWFPKVNMTGIDLERAYLQKNFTVRNASINNPQVKLTSYNEPGRESKKIDPKDVLDQLLSKNLKFLNLKNADFNNASFQLIYANDTKRRDLVLNQISGKVRNFNLNEKSRKIDSRLFYADDIDLRIKNYTYPLPDSLYTFKAKEIGVSLAQSRVYLDSVVVLPKYGKYQFANRLGYEKDRIEFSARLIELKRFNFRDFILKDIVNAGVININHFNVKNFRDKRLPFPKSQQSLMPQSMIRDFGTPLKIGQLNLAYGKITYEEIVEDGQKPGEIKFTNVSANIKNITNMPSAWKKNDLLSLDAEAYLMGKGKIAAQMRTNISNKQNKFTFSGTISPMDLRTVNPMLENVAYVSVKSGYNDRLDFAFNGNEDFAVGEMKFRYNDLKISVIKKKTGDKGGFASFLANTFIINNKNPAGKNLRVGEIYFERDKQKSMFNYLWKSLLSGIKPSLGINEKKDKKDKGEKASLH